MSRPAPATSALDHYAPSLDGLRGICIGGVVAFHACSFNGYTATIPGGFHSQLQLVPAQPQVLSHPVQLLLCLVAGLQ